MSILCCQKAFIIIQILQHIFWTWVWSPPPFEQCSKKMRIWRRLAPLIWVLIKVKGSQIYKSGININISIHCCYGSDIVHIGMICIFSETASTMVNKGLPKKKRGRVKVFSFSWLDKSINGVSNRLWLKPAPTDSSRYILMSNLKPMSWIC